MDNSLVKGHYFHGQALIEIGLYDEAITSLMRGTCMNAVDYYKYPFMQDVRISNIE